MPMAAGSGVPERGPRYWVRRVAWHVLNHAWEIEDRILRASGE